MADEKNASSPGTKTLGVAWKDFIAMLISPPYAASLATTLACIGVYTVLANAHDIPPLAAADSQSTLQADAYCRDVSVNAAALGNFHSVAALVLTVVAVLGALAQATQDGGTSLVTRLRRPLVFASAVSVVLAVFLFFRASAANELASATNNARSEPRR